MDERNRDLPENTVTLDLIPKEGERLLEELSSGNMVILRSKDDFLYVIEHGGQYHMFSHTRGAAGGGQRQFPVDEKYKASVRKLSDLADYAYLCIYDKSLNLYGVLQSAEDGILEMFPSTNTDGDETVEFKPWDRTKDGGSGGGKKERAPENGPPGSDFPSENFSDLLKFND